MFIAHLYKAKQDMKRRNRKRCSSFKYLLEFSSVSIEQQRNSSQGFNNIPMYLDTFISLPLAFSSLASIKPYKQRRKAYMLDKELAWLAGTLAMIY